MWFDCDRAGFETALAPDYMQVGLLARSEPELPCVDFARLAVVGAIEYSDRVCVDLIVLLDILNLDPIFFESKRACDSVLVSCEHVRVCNQRQRVAVDGWQINSPIIRGESA